MYKFSRIFVWIEGLEGLEWFMVMKVLFFDDLEKLVLFFVIWKSWMLVRDVLEFKLGDCKEEVVFLYFKGDKVLWVDDFVFKMFNFNLF